MHLFEIGSTRYGHGGNEYDEDEQDAAGVLLGDLGLTEGDRFDYRYDFGDDSVHTVTVETIIIHRGAARAFVGLSANGTVNSTILVRRRHDCHGFPSMRVAP